MRLLLLVRGASGLLHLAPLDAEVLASLTLLGVAVLTPQQERLAREIGV